MLDNQFDIVSYKQFLKDLESSNDSVFQEYSKKVQAALANFEQAELTKLRNGVIEKWKKNLEIYANSTDVEVSEYAVLVKSNFLKLLDGSVSLDQFLKSTEKSNSNKLDINSILYIREQITALF